MLLRPIRSILRGIVPWESVRRDLRVARQASRSALAAAWNAVAHRGELRGFRNVKINVGCGGLVIDGWVNVDLNPAPGAYYVNVVDGLPFSTGAASHIHCEHFLEHLDYECALRFLAECYRVLGPDGSLRIIVPDAEKYARAYVAGDREFFAQVSNLGNPATPLDLPMLSVNQSFRMGGNHLHAWDFETLEAALRKIGFPRVELSRRGDVAPDLRIDGTDSWRPVESLYANAWK
jgi:SAM-dependent methyltransferase